jgi:uncharacterized protein with von Willebrand factor type A (vWA) domain
MDFHAKDLIGGLLSRKRLAKAPELSKYTIEHSAIDQFIHDDLRDRATYFRQALEECPEVDVTRPDGTQDRVRIDAAEGLNSDVFFALHDQRDAPRILPPDRVKPSHELFRQIMDHYIEHPDTKSARARTRGDEIASALGMMKASDVLRPIIEEELAEEAARAQEMEERQRAMQAAQEAAQNAANDPTLTPEQAQEMIQAAAQARREAREALSGLADQQQAGGGLPMRVAGAVDRAASEAKDAAEGWANLPGNQLGNHSNMSPDQAIELARKWANNDSAARVASLMGRMERDFRFKHSTRTVGGREIPVDVELGNDLALVLPSEMMYLAIPETRMLFYKKYADAQLLQWEMLGSAESGKGPFIMLVDFSGSMGGDRHIWAKAVALSLLTIAYRERRAVTVIAFDTAILGEWTFEPRTAVDLSDALELASLDPRGGTHPYPAMKRAEDILHASPAFRQADIVVVTDGECHFSDEDLEMRERLQTMGCRIHGISIECNVTRYLGAMCSTVIPVYEMTEPSEATDMLVQSVI